jgi:hypothetical protein
MKLIRHLTCFYCGASREFRTTCRGGTRHRFLYACPPACGVWNHEDEREES